MTSTNASGCGAESVSRAARPSRSCPIGWRHPAHFSLRCRQQACERIAAGDSVEQAAPHCKDPTRLPDPSTLRRWAQRRLLSLWCWVKAGVIGAALSAGTHHPCLGSGRALPYSADRGKKSVNRQALDELKQQIPLMDYLQAHDWQPARPLSRGRWMGLCPLHEDHKPSFLVDPNKNLFYCYGCGRGGDVIRFAELYHQVKFPQAVALLRQWRGLAPLLHEAARFLSHSVTPPQRGGCLSVPTRNPLAGTDRAHADRLRARRLPARLADAVGLPSPGSASGRPGDRRWLRRLRASRSSFRWKAISMAAAFRLRRRRTASCRALRAACTHGTQVRPYPEVILVEGLFDYAVLVAGRLSQRHLLAGNPSQCAPVSATLRRSPNRLSGL